MSDAPTQSVPDSPGKGGRVGKYRILAKIGEGPVLAYASPLAGGIGRGTSGQRTVKAFLPNCLRNTGK